MIDQLEQDRPGTKRVMLAALHNVRPTHLLDQRLWAALGLRGLVEDEEFESPRAEPLAPETLLRD
jgi:hypothetical protein